MAIVVNTYWQLCIHLMYTAHTHGNFCPPCRQIYFFSKTPSVLLLGISKIVFAYWCCCCTHIHPLVWICCCHGSHGKCNLSNPVHILSPWNVATHLIECSFCEIIAYPPPLGMHTYHLCFYGLFYVFCSSCMSIDLIYRTSNFLKR